MRPCSRANGATLSWPVLPPSSTTSSVSDDAVWVAAEVEAADRSEEPDSDVLGYRSFVVPGAVLGQAKWRIVSDKEIAIARERERGAPRRSLDDIESHRGSGMRGRGKLSRAARPLYATASMRSHRSLPLRVGFRTSEREISPARRLALSGGRTASASALKRAAGAA